MYRFLGSVNPVTDELIRAMKLTEDRCLQISFGGRHISARRACALYFSDGIIR